MDLDFFRNQYNKYQINSLIFNFVILAGFCFVIVFTVNQGINIDVILGVLLVLFGGQKYLANKKNAFGSVVNIFDKTGQLHELVNKRKEIVCEFGLKYNILVDEFNSMHNKYVSNIGGFIKGYSLVDEENVSNFIKQLFELAITDAEDNKKLNNINQEISRTIGQYLYAVEMYLNYIKRKDWYFGKNCNIICSFEDGDRLVFDIVKKVYPVIKY
jgi:hypothetical protein